MRLALAVFTLLMVALVMPASAATPAAGAPDQTIFCRTKLSNGTERCTISDQGVCPKDADNQHWTESTDSCKCGADPKSGDECVQLENPLVGETTDISALIGTLIKAALGVSGAVALVMFFWGARAWVISQGNAEKIKAGTDTMVWTGIGLLILFASYILVNVIIQFITGTGQGAPPAQ